VHLTSSAAPPGSSRHVIGDAEINFAMTMTIILIATGLLCFALFFKFIDFFDKI
jgi:hypothetical protein